MLQGDHGMQEVIHKPHYCSVFYASTGIQSGPVDLYIY